MLVRAEGGWIAVPVNEFRNRTFEFSQQKRTLDDGSVEVVFTLVPITDERADAIRLDDYRRYGPPSSCEALDASISRRLAKEAARAEKREARERASAGRGAHPAGTQVPAAGDQTASGEQATPPKGPRMRLVR